MQNVALGSGQSQIYVQSRRRTLLENTPAEKDLGVLAEEKFNMSQQCLLARIANCILVILTIQAYSILHMRRKPQFFK